MVDFLQQFNPVTQAFIAMILVITLHLFEVFDFHFANQTAFLILLVGVLPLVAELVVLLPFILIREDLVGLVDFLESGGRVVLLASKTSGGLGTRYEWLFGGVPLVIAEDPREALAFTAALWFEDQPEVQVAVTGTNGKTSVASFVRQIWQELDLKGKPGHGTAPGQIKQQGSDNDAGSEQTPPQTGK